MPMPCWLHPEGDEHVPDRLVGVRTDKGVVPADKACAQSRVDDAWIVDASEINVGAVLS
jgi:hypothetical protein